MGGKTVDSEAAEEVEGGEAVEDMVVVMEVGATTTGDEVTIVKRNEILFPLLVSQGRTLTSQRTWRSSIRMMSRRCQMLGFLNNNFSIWILHDYEMIKFLM